MGMATHSRDDDVVRLERQLRRLRNRLADAWASDGSPVVIRRIEGLMQRRWQLLDKTRHQHP